MGKFGSRTNEHIGDLVIGGWIVERMSLKHQGGAENLAMISLLMVFGLADLQVIFLAKFDERCVDTNKTDIKI